MFMRLKSISLLLSTLGILSASYAQSVTVTAPAAGASLVAGTMQTIKWTSSGSSASPVAVQYSAVNGSSWYTVSSSVPLQNSSLNWTVPLDFSKQCKIQVLGSSSGTFSIVPPSGCIAYNLDSVNNAQWHASAYVISGGGLADPSNISYNNNLLKMHVAANGTSGAELQSMTLGQYGLYAARIKAAGGGDAVSAAFTYSHDNNGAGNNHEIDVELYGARSNNADFVVWYSDGSAGTKRQRRYIRPVLPFDVTTGFHDYAFKWASDTISFFVDWQCVGWVTKDSESQSQPDEDTMPALPSRQSYFLLQARSEASGQTYPGGNAFFMSAMTSGITTTGTLPQNRNNGAEIIGQKNSAGGKGVDIEYYLAGKSAVSAQVFDMHGRLVRKIAENKTVLPGYNTLSWDGRMENNKSAASGRYLVHMRIGSITRTISVFKR